jgi:putative hemolysin
MSHHCLVVKMGSASIIILTTPQRHHQRSRAIQLSTRYKGPFQSVSKKESAHSIL